MELDSKDAEIEKLKATAMNSETSSLRSADNEGDDEDAKSGHFFEGWLLISSKQHIRRKIIFYNSEIDK